MADTVSIVITLFSCFLVVVILIAYILTLWGIMKGIIEKNIMISRVIIGSMITLTLFLISGLAYFYYSITALSENASFSVRSIGTGSYQLAQEMMIFTFIARVEYIFKSSVLQISKCIVRWLYCSWFISLICGILSLTLNVAANGNSSIYSSLFAVIYILSYIILSVVLIVLFIHKIRKLIVSTIYIANRSHSESSIVNIDKLIDMKFLYTAIRNGILVLIAITSSLIFLVLVFLFARLHQVDLPQVLQIDATINVLSIWLLFSFSSRIYDKVCWKLHGFCMKRWLHSLQLKLGGSSMNKMDNMNIDKVSENTTTRNIQLASNLSNIITKSVHIPTITQSTSNPIRTSSKNNNYITMDIPTITQSISKPITSDDKKHIPMLQTAHSDFL